MILYSRLKCFKCSTSVMHILTSFQKKGDQPRSRAVADAACMNCGNYDKERTIFAGGVMEVPEGYVPMKQAAEMTNVPYNRIMSLLAIAKIRYVRRASFVFVDPSSVKQACA